MAPDGSGGWKQHLDLGADPSKDLSARGLPNSCETVTQSTVNPVHLSDSGVVFSSG